MIIDGKKIAENIYIDLKNEILTLNKTPRLAAVLVGDNSSSLRYIKQKKKWANFVGIDFDLRKLDMKISETQLLEEIKILNEDNNISGYIVQLPLPNHIDSKKIINAIFPEKDVDGFHPENQGKLMIGDSSGFAPCTPAGIMDIFSNINVDVKGKIVTVLGRSNIVGKPIANMLINAGATVISCNSLTEDISVFTQKSDIVICATGQPGILKGDMVQQKTIIIDVGFSVIDGKIYGDADFENIEKQGNNITPVPGGVGPLTVANLMKNTLKAFKNS